ncbi:MAG: glycosyltransferase family 4 protein, partial [Candidatus Anstonellales archaeon]
YQPINFLLTYGLSRIPNVDIIEVYGYSKNFEGFVKKLLSFKKPKIFRLLNFPDNKTIEFLKINLNFFSRIIVSSQSIKDELLFNQIPQLNIITLSPLLTMTRWESAKQIKPLTFLQRPYKILNVSRMCNDEDIKFFLLLAKEILSRNDKVNFMIVGKKDEKIREFARELGISHKVDILGWRDDMPEVMAMAHIYISTKASSSISRSLFEAMASGVVCVVPDVGGMSDFINEDTGIVVKRRNLNDYLKAVMTLISDPVSMQNISAMGYAYAKANFSAEVVSKVEELVYEEVITEWVSKYI